MVTPVDQFRSRGIARKLMKWHLSERICILSEYLQDDLLDGNELIHTDQQNESKVVASIRLFMELKFQNNEFESPSKSTNRRYDSPQGIIDHRISASTVAFAICSPMRE